ncbi:MAG: M48 family metallopeptidase [Prevotellaceae bacterium]|jgi:predicted Zn-dependent protease|nr:M48 family metallopeptidase [Prevotellaceae bacterium]
MVTGKYFDGKSSQPQKVEVVLNVGFDELKISSETINFVWKLQDLNYEKFGSFLEIKLVENSGDFLTIDNKEFNAEFIKQIQRKKDVGFYKPLLEMTYKNYIIIAVAILGLIVAGYFIAVPYIAEKAVAIIPESVDTRIGDMAGLQLLHGAKIDSEKSEILAQFADELKLNNTKPLYFNVIDTNIVNACALPDGEIVVYTGILDKMTDYQQLAGLLGHEVTHINERHSMKMLCKNLAGYILISAIFTDVNGIVAILAENAHSINTLSYSRAFETESDEKSVDILIQNHINPQGVVSLLELLQDEEKMLGKVPEIILTHPITEHRISHIQTIINRRDFLPQNNQKLQSLFKKLKAKN